VVNCSGRGDKDVHTAIKYLKIWKNMIEAPP
jgi:tryptophan synthase beta subunit